MRRLADLVLSTLLAPPCAVCDRVLDRPVDGAVCDACWRAVRRITPPVCNRCGSPLPSMRYAAHLDGPYCAHCRHASSPIDRARAIGGYEGALRAIVHALKYDRRSSIVPRLASLMRSSGADVLANIDALVPVPLHPRRRRARGFNQARVLADAIGGPVWDVLVRVRHTAPQVELPAHARHVNVRDAFAIGQAGLKTRLYSRLAIACSGGALDPPTIRGAVVVLIDDVATTGATLDACARVLKAAGAHEVRALTAARVVSERPSEWLR
jgi:predicted amidophosphoribosyltransferase